jgi:hypothetical protein
VLVGSQAAVGDVELVAHEALAAADGIRVTVTMEPSILVPELVDLGAPTAQARSDSLGNSASFAAAPFPGDLLLRGPALLLPAAGLPADVIPPFPAVVEAEHPTTPEATLEVPGYRLTATSEDRVSAATASVGNLLAGASALAVTSTATSGVEEDGTVVARSSTSIEGLELAGLSIARIETSASVRARSAEDVEVDGGLAVDLISAAGLDVRVDADGLTVAGSHLPIRLLDFVPLAGLLGVDGLDLELLPEVVSDGSIQSGGLMVRTTTVLAEGIPSVLPAGTTVTVELVLGRASASAGASTRELTPTDGSAPLTEVGPLTGSAPSAPATGSAGHPVIRQGPASSVITSTTAVLARWSATAVFPLLAMAALGLLWASRSFRPRGANR